MKRVKEKILPGFDSKLTYRADTHRYNTRAASKGVINIPKFNTHYFGYLSTTYQAISDWNSFLLRFPKETTSELSHEQLRSFLTKHLLEHY